MPTARYMRKYRLEHPEYRENDKVLDPEDMLIGIAITRIQEKRKLQLKEYRQKLRGLKE